MDRRYYALRAGILVLAVVTVAVTSGLGSHRVAHTLNQARYSAPQQIERLVDGAIESFLRNLFRRR